MITSCVFVPTLQLITSACRVEFVPSPKRKEEEGKEIRNNNSDEDKVINVDEELDNDEGDLQRYDILQKKLFTII